MAFRKYMFELDLKCGKLLTQCSQCLTQNCCGNYLSSSTEMHSFALLPEENGKFRLYELNSILFKMIYAKF